MNGDVNFNPKGINPSYVVNVNKNASTQNSTQQGVQDRSKASEDGLVHWAIEDMEVTEVTKGNVTTITKTCRDADGKIIITEVIEKEGNVQKCVATHYKDGKKTSVTNATITGDKKEYETCGYENGKLKYKKTGVEKGDKETSVMDSYDNKGKLASRVAETQIGGYDNYRNKVTTLYDKKGNVINSSEETFEKTKTGNKQNVTYKDKDGKTIVSIETVNTKNKALGYGFDDTIATKKGPNGEILGTATYEKGMFKCYKDASGNEIDGLQWSKLGEPEVEKDKNAFQKALDWVANLFK